MIDKDELWDELADKAVSLMILAYIVNSFIATGYDTLDVIADLTDEDISEVEAIIRKDFVGDERFLNHATGNLNTSGMWQFKFQPGHRKRIQKFIEEAKCLVKEKTVKSSKRKSLKQKASEPICHGSKIAKTEAKTVHKDEPWDEQVIEMMVVSVVSLKC